MKITALISKKSGKVTLSVEGAVGSQCTDLTKKLEEGLGMKGPEREMLPEFYQQQTDLTQQQGAQ